ncbi:hypothetical protein [Phycicoccus flavus]|uniref:hypothetical protein n=1 Tax=Phycicoccus flavus TaxID=2502783 RepID=UPI000FEC0E7E|nr:hypothetical protein [Phycicoccus flavus]NHA70118.1 hypothetical protein [Phycicoccus flavus]
MTATAPRGLENAARVEDRDPEDVVGGPVHVVRRARAGSASGRSILLLPLAVGLLKAEGAWALRER